MKPQSVNQAVNAACELWGCEPGHLTGPDKTMRHVGPRHALAWWLHTRLGVSLSGVARGLGARHHTSILHACRAVEESLTAKRPTKRNAWIARLAREIDEAFDIRAKPAPVEIVAPSERVAAKPPAKHAKPKRRAYYGPGFPKQKPCLSCGKAITLKSRNDNRRCGACHSHHASLSHLEGVAA